MFEELSDSIRESEKVPDDGSGGAKDSPANTADGPPVAQESNALQRAKVTSGNIRPVHPKCQFRDARHSSINSDTQSVSSDARGAVV